MTTRSALGFVSLVALLGGCGGDPAEQPCVSGAGQLCTVAGTAVAGFNGDALRATETELYLPMDIAFGPDQNLYFTDWNNHRIRCMDARGMIRTVAGSGMLGDGPDGPALEARFNHPTSFVFDTQGRMVISAWHNSRVKRVDLETGMAEDLYGTGARAYTGDDGDAAQAALDLPASIAFDADENLYVMDQANQVVRRIDTEGKISRFAGQCITGACADGEAPTGCAGTNKFACLTTDPGGCGKPCASAFAGDGGPALQARFSQPVGQAADPAGHVAFDSDGNLYLADTGNHRIRRIDRDGIVTTVAGNGMGKYAGDGGPATEASLQRPVDIEIDDDGTLYIADTYNSCVRAVDPEGTIETVAGVCGKRGKSSEAGLGTEMLLNRPYGLGLGDGKLYIADTYNHRILALEL